MPLRTRGAHLSGGKRFTALSAASLSGSLQLENLHADYGSLPLARHAAAWYPNVASNRDSFYPLPPFRMARTLPTIQVNGMAYFIDERLHELRNVENSVGWLRFETDADMLAFLLQHADWNTHIPSHVFI